MSIEVMNQALHALELTQEGSEFAAHLPAEWSLAAGKDYDTMKEAIATLRAALAEAAMQRLTDVQQEMDCYGDGNVYRGQRSSDSQAQTIYVQEPVAWVNDLSRPQPHCVTDLKYCSVSQHQIGDHLKYVPLYTHPPRREWVGLTDDEVFKCLPPEEDEMAFARAIEQTCKEKNS